MLMYLLTILNGGLLALNVGFVAATGNPVSVGAATFIGVCLITQLISLAKATR